MRFECHDIKGKAVQFRLQIRTLKVLGYAADGKLRVDYSAGLDQRHWWVEAAGNPLAVSAYLCQRLVNLGLLNTLELPSLNEWGLKKLFYETTAPNVSDIGLKIWVSYLQSRFAKPCTCIRFKRENSVVHRKGIGMVTGCGQGYNEDSEFEILQEEVITCRGCLQESQSAVIYC